MYLFWILPSVWWWCSFYCLSYTITPPSEEHPMKNCIVFIWNALFSDCANYYGGDNSFSNPSPSTPQEDSLVNHYFFNKNYIFSDYSIKYVGALLIIHLPPPLSHHPYENIFFNSTLLIKNPFLEIKLRMMLLSKQILITIY